MKFSYFPVFLVLVVLTMLGVVTISEANDKPTDVSTVVVSVIDQSTGEGVEYVVRPLAPDETPGPDGGKVIIKGERYGDLDDSYYSCWKHQTKTCYTCETCTIVSTTHID